MTNIHMIVGTLTIVAYVVVLALNVRSASSGSEFPWQKMVSFGAATLLVLQYLLGFSLLGDDKSITGYHYLLALVAIIPVGFEHGYASQRPDPRERGKLATLANVATLALILVAYTIGQSN
jgi:heme A synthase